MGEKNKFEENETVFYEYRGEEKEGTVKDVNKTMFGDFTYKVEFEDETVNGIGEDQLSSFNE